MKKELGKVRSWQVSFSKNAGAKVDAHERAVGFAISTMMSEKQERWACSTPEIARRAGVNDKTASKYIQRLKRRGWIGQKRRKHTTPLYWLIDLDQEQASHAGSYDQEQASDVSRTGVPRPQEQASHAGERFLEERFLEERFLEESVLEPKPKDEFSSGQPGEMAGILTEEIITYAIRHDLDSLDKMSPELLDVLEAAAWELLPGGKSNGYASWHASGVTYGAILEGLREVAPPEECRLLLEAIEHHREATP